MKKIMLKMFGRKSEAEKREEQWLREQALNMNKWQVDANVIPHEDTTLIGHSHYVSALTVLPDGRLASASGDSTIRVWTVLGDKRHCEAWQTGCSDPVVDALAALPDGRLASGGGDDTTIKVWAVLSWGRDCEATLIGHSNYVSALTVLPDGRLVSGSLDNTIKVWAVLSEKALCDATLIGHSDWVNALAVLPDGRLASGSSDSTIKVWAVLGGRECCEATLTGHSNPISALTVLPDGRLASGSSDSTINVWTVLAGGGCCDATLTGHSNSISALTVLPDGRLASGSWDNTINVWTVLGGGGRCEATLIGHSDSVRALTVLQDGRLVSGGADYTIKLWDVGVRPVNAKQATTPVRAAEVRLSVDEGEAARIFDQVLPRSVPANDGKTSEDSAGSERDGLSRLSLSPVINTIAFSELTLGDVLGRGGFGVVFAAVWQEVTQVAVKQLSGQLTRDLLEEFQREIAVHARLRHPNILLLYGVCTESPCIAMVMEFMAQGSLYEVLRNPAELDWSLRFCFARDMVAGLLYLHGQGIVHRDLKSLNILVDEQGRAKVSDFGLSKIQFTTALMTEGVVGTCHWMAPELLSGGAANSEASDVYATGVVFWEIAARKLPYEGKNQREIGLFVKGGGRETMPADTPSFFADLTTRCWAQRAEARPSMIDVARDLRATLLPSGATSVRATGSSSSVVLESDYAAYSRR